MRFIDANISKTLLGCDRSSVGFHRFSFRHNSPLDIVFQFLWEDHQVPYVIECEKFMPRGPFRQAAWFGSFDEIRPNRAHILKSIIERHKVDSTIPTARVPAGGINGP